MAHSSNRMRGTDYSDRNEERGCSCESKRKMNNSKCGQESLYRHAKDRIDVLLSENGTEVYRVDPDHNIKITAGHSAISIMTPRTRRTNNDAGCINPLDCPRMQTLGSDRMLATMTEHDRLRLEDAIKEACDGVAQLRTFDDVEELVEIHNCMEIQRKFSTFIDQKRNKLERSKARREAELLERKQEFHKRVMDRVKMEHREQTQSQEQLLSVLGSLAPPSYTRNEMEISISNRDHSKDFNPRAESTRIENVKAKCSCRCSAKNQNFTN